jgi:hypothetical protein
VTKADEVVNHLLAHTRYLVVTSFFRY